jgi:DNA-binding beta-propeller fold protein YncE
MPVAGKPPAGEPAIPFEACAPEGQYVFVSYARADRAIVYPELARIMSLGVRVWFDQGIEPGNEWPDQVAAALAGAAAVVVMITPEAATSRYVRNEVNLAVARAIKVLSVHLAPTVLPPGLELQLGSIQGVMAWQLDEPSYADSLARMLATVVDGPDGNVVDDPAQQITVPVPVPPRTPVRVWPRWPVMLATVAVAVAAGVGAAVALRGGGGVGSGGQDRVGGGTHGAGAAALTAPPCGSGAAAGTSLPAQGTTKFTQVSAGAALFGVAVSADGRFVFAVRPSRVAVLAVRPGLRLAYLGSYLLPGTTGKHGAGGAVLTPDGNYLLVATGSGIDVMSVTGLEGGGYPSAGTLTAPGLNGYERGIQVAVTPDGAYAFVALQDRNRVAMFNLRAAFSSGFTQSGYIGMLDVGAEPVGLAVSQDGRWLYTASWGTSSPQGIVSVVSIAAAARNPATAVVSQETGLCNPTRIALSPGGGTVWVTSRLSNYLLGFSAAALRSRPSHALVARVEVGLNPTGVAVVNGGSRIVVVDADDQRAGVPTLAVINAAFALRRKSALLGLLPGAQGARELAVSPDGLYLYVADIGTGSVQVVDLTTLP